MLIVCVPRFSTATQLAQPAIRWFKKTRLQVKNKYLHRKLLEQRLLLPVPEIPPYEDVSL